MSGLSTGRLTAKSFFQNAVQAIRSQRPVVSSTRQFSHTVSRKDDNKSEDKRKTLLQSLYGSSNPQPVTPPAQPKTRSTMQDLSQALMLDTLSRAQNLPIENRGLDGTGLERLSPEKQEDYYEPYHFHIYSHRHNTHITFSKPNRDTIISLSCGNIGFRKSKRKHYDSAYQLAAYVLQRIYHDGWHKKVRRLQVVLRDFGPGREAATKVLMSPEGKLIRDKIVSVTDATRIKFGGTKSKNPRRI
jgi:small subunit ribosomal protein S11